MKFFCRPSECSSGAFAASRVGRQVRSSCLLWSWFWLGCQSGEAQQHHQYGNCDQGHVWVLKVNSSLCPVSTYMSHYSCDFSLIFMWSVHPVEYIYKPLVSCSYILSLFPLTFTVVALRLTYTVHRVLRTFSCAYHAASTVRATPSYIPKQALCRLYKKSGLGEMRWDHVTMIRYNQEW